MVWGSHILLTLGTRISRQEVAIELVIWVTLTRMLAMKLLPP
ncbi:hypothetical protein LINPERHAP1_LOCUS7446 [Linum perenne]